MLPKKHRISREQFDRVFSTGTAAQGENFHIKFLKDSGNDHPRVSVVVPKKVVRKPSKRNRVRRVMYAAIENILESIHPGVLMIVFVKDAGVGMPKQVVEEELASLFQKAEVCTIDKNS